MTRLASQETRNEWAKPRAGRTAALLEGALTAVRLGIPVLPLNGKAPVVRLVPNGVKNATVDEDQIRSWWSDGSTFNVGGAVPRGMAVLDVDPRNGGDESLEELRREHGELGPTLRCDSGGDDRGYHLWYRHVGARLSARGLAGVDLKTYGGYLVLPPSIHPSSGRQYSWARIAAPSELPSSLYGVLLNPPTTSLVREYEHPLVRLQQQHQEGSSDSLVREYEQLGYSHCFVNKGRVGDETYARGTGVEGVLFPDDDSRERFRYVGYARELGWSQSHFLQEIRREGSPVAGYAALALNGKHGDDLARILGDDWRRSEEQDRERGWVARSSTEQRATTTTSGDVRLPSDIGLWVTNALAAIQPSRRRYDLGALVEAFARIGAREGRRFEGSYRYLAVQSGVRRHEHVYDLALELETLGVVKATNRGEVTESDPTRWALLGEGDEATPFVPALVPIWTSVALGWRGREVWRVLCSGVTEMKQLDLALGIDRDTLRPELERLEERGLARRTGNGRWVRWVGLSMENATGTESDREALDAVTAEYRKERATFKKNNFRNVGSKPVSERPGSSQELAEAQSAYEQAAEEFVDWSSHLRTVVSYGATDEQEAAREQLAELEQAVERTKERRDAAVATPRRSTEKVSEQALEEEKSMTSPRRRLSNADREVGMRQMQRMRRLVEIWQMTDQQLVRVIEEALDQSLLDLEIEIDFDLVRTTGQVVNSQTGEVLCILAA